MTPKTVYKELPKLLKEFNVSKEYLANKLGLSYGTIYSWVTGKRKPKPITISRIEQIFNGFRRVKESK